MSNGNGQKPRLRTVEEIMDEELMKDGWTREQLEEQKCLGELLDEKLAAGYSMNQINAMWQGKTNQEILADAVGNETRNGKGKFAHVPLSVEDVHAERRKDRERENRS